MGLWSTKTIADLQSEARREDSDSLRRALGRMNLSRSASEQSSAPGFSC